MENMGFAGLHPWVLLIFYALDTRQPLESGTGPTAGVSEREKKKYRKVDYNRRVV